MIFGRYFSAGRKRRAAEKVGIEAGVLAECPVCRDITDAAHPELLPQADRIIDDSLQRCDERLRDFHGDGDALKRLVRQLVEESDIHCTCEKSG